MGVPSAGNPSPPSAAKIVREIDGSVVADAGGVLIAAMPPVNATASKAMRKTRNVFSDGTVFIY